MSCPRNRWRGSEFLDGGTYALISLSPHSIKSGMYKQVQPGELEKFHAAYGTLLKASMSTLRKRDKKREKQRQEDAARKKRRLQEEITLDGPKRGAGRRKRQRKLKAALKLEEAKKRAQERVEAKARTKAS